MDVVAARSALLRALQSNVRTLTGGMRSAAVRVLLTLALVPGAAFAVVATPTEPLDINRAGVEQLAEQLPGIGLVKAQAIVDWRDTNGPFDSVDALLQVPGIGPKTLERLRPLVTVGGARSDAADARERATVLEVRRLVERARSVAGAHTAGSP